MRKFEELNYYEIFEIPINASNFEIRQAYRNILSIYDDDSTISYAFFTEEEEKLISHVLYELRLNFVDESQKASAETQSTGSAEAEKSDGEAPESPGEPPADK